jgi:hypothetical protein
MSSSRVHSSFTGVPVSFAMRAASTMKSFIRRRPKPPPPRVRWIVILLSSMPSAFDTRLRPGAGFCVGAQISILPSAQRAVAFCGSRLACEMYG